MADEIPYMLEDTDAEFERVKEVAAERLDREAAAIEAPKPAGCFNNIISRANVQALM